MQNINKKNTGDVLFVGNFCFPEGNAASNAVISLGKIFKKIGYEVNYLGTSKNTEDRLQKECFDEFCGSNFKTPSFSTELKDYKKKYNETINFIKHNIKQLKFVILYNSPSISLYNKLLINWCKKNNIKTIVYVGDWMAPSGSMIFKIFKWIDTEYRMRFLNKSVDGIICMSTFLQKYYKKQKTIIIPPLFDSKQIGKISKKQNPKIKLIYMGDPFPIDGRKVNKKAYKDRLDLVIEYLSKIKDGNFVLNIYGLTKEQYLRVIKHHKNISDERFIFHGKQDRNIVLEELKKSDFMIFLRNKTRTTQAGFSTKFAESLTCGIPVITTNTSDLSKYLKNGYNGFFIQLDESGILELEQILKLSPNKISKIKNNCFSERKFLYENYENVLSSFIDELY